MGRSYCICHEEFDAADALGLVRADVIPSAVRKAGAQPTLSATDAMSRVVIDVIHAM